MFLPFSSMHEVLDSIPSTGTKTMYLSMSINIYIQSAKKCIHTSRKEKFVILNLLKHHDINTIPLTSAFIRGALSSDH